MEWYLVLIVGIAVGYLLNPIINGLIEVIRNSLKRM